MDEQLPSAWAAYLPLVTGLVRAILAAAGGAGFTWALAVNADQIQMAVSGAMILASALWSFWQKLQAMRALRRAATSPMTAPTPKLPA